MVVPPEPIRGRVDHLDALGAEVGQGGGDVGDGIADVVDALAPPGQAWPTGVSGERATSWTKASPALSSSSCTPWSSITSSWVTSRPSTCS